MSTKSIDADGVRTLIAQIKSRFFAKSEAQSVSSLSVDTIPTSGSSRLVTSGGVRSFVSLYKKTGTVTRTSGGTGEYVWVVNDAADTYDRSYTDLPVLSDIVINPQLTITTAFANPSSEHYLLITNSLTQPLTIGFNTPSPYMRVIGDTTIELPAATSSEISSVEVSAISFGEAGSITNGAVIITAHTFKSQTPTSLL